MNILYLFFFLLVGEQKRLSGRYQVAPGTVHSSSVIFEGKICELGLIVEVEKP